MTIIKIHQSSPKEQIADSFSKGVANYISHSQVQKCCADKLLILLKNRKNMIPEGAILEIGCGTGFVTQGLINQYPSRLLDIIDISPEMLNHCQKNLLISDLQRKRIQFKQIDGEQLDVANNSYAAIVSNFTVQWFQNLGNSINRLLKTLRPHGILLISFPNDQSFPEWKNACNALNLPFTRNHLPNTINLVTQLPIETTQSHFHEDKITLTYKNASQFFRSLKIIGAGTNLNNQKLSIAQMKQLINYWDTQTPYREINITYHVTFLVVTKNKNLVY